MTQLPISACWVLVLEAHFVVEVALDEDLGHGVGGSGLVVGEVVFGLGVGAEEAALQVLALGRVGVEVLGLELSDLPLALEAEEGEAGDREDDGDGGDEHPHEYVHCIDWRKEGELELLVSVSRQIPPEKVNIGSGHTLEREK